MPGKKADKPDRMQCEKLLGLAGGNTKKRGNKKSGESITPIRYNVVHMYIFARCFISLVVFHANLVVFQAFGVYSIYMFPRTLFGVSPGQS